MPAATFPDQLVDVKKVIAWVRSHAKIRHGSAHDLHLCGSAGGQLSALAALTPNDATLQPGFEDADTTVAAAISLYGDYDWLETSALRNARESYLAPV
jgi:acetyl esterase/lipase